MCIQLCKEAKWLKAVGYKTQNTEYKMHYIQMLKIIIDDNQIMISYHIKYHIPYTKCNVYGVFNMT